MQPIVSIVIPTHNRGAMLERCLRSVLAAAPAAAEVIVSDDGSTDDTRERVAAVRGTDERVRCLSSKRAGPAAARNRGWRAAAAPIVAFIDDDCVAEPGWVDRLVGALQGSSGWAGVEGRTRPEGAIRGFFYHTIDASEGSYLTCNIAFRRSELERVGGFDERFPHPASEDLDLAYRVIESCGPIGFAPDAVVRHAVIPVGPRHYLRRVRYDPSIYRLFARHPARFAASNRLVRVPLLASVSRDRPPHFVQIFLYLLSYRLHHAYFCLRDGKTLREKLVGSVTHLLCAAASFGYVFRSHAGYRDGFRRGEPGEPCGCA